MAARRRLQDRVTDEARSGLDHLADRDHLSRTAMLEALGLLAHRITLPQIVIDEAKRIDRERRNR